MYPEANDMKGAIPNSRPEDTKAQIAKQKDGKVWGFCEWNYDFYRGRELTHCKAASRKLRK